MVYYFTSNVVEPPATIYVGKDKFENEELIKFGWDCDVCCSPPFHDLTPTFIHRFHADNLSSAHVYLRLTPEQKWDALPPALLDDCAQLTKANSIEGNKKPTLSIIYTPFPNLLKTADMATGQVGFQNATATKHHHVPTRLAATLNRLQKTRTTLPASALPGQKETYLSEQRAEKRGEEAKRREEEERVARERREEKERRGRGYEELMGGGGGRSNEEGFDEEDFM